MKINVFVLWRKYEWSDKPELVINSVDMSCIAGYQLVGQREIDIGDVPEFDTGAHVLATIIKLNEEKDALRQKIEMIDDKIASLACLEHKPEVVA